MAAECRNGISVHGQTDPWEERKEILFGQELARQARYVAGADRELRAALAAGDADGTWYAVQCLLVAAANMSKILWPPAPEAEFGSRLRAWVGVDDTSPLRSRVLRNSFEHFGRELARWIREHREDVLADALISDFHPSEFLPHQLVLRHFEPRALAVSFLGERLDLEPLIAAARDVRQRLRDYSPGQYL